MKDLSIYTDDFIAYCRLRKGLSEKTVRAYSADLSQLWEKAGGSLSKQSVSEYISYLHETYKPHTCRRKIAVIKAYVHYLIIEEIIKSSPFEKIETSFREPSLLPKTIPLNVINSLLKAATSLRHIFLA